jgi:hypothetical protein
MGIGRGRTPALHDVPANISRGIPDFEMGLSKIGLFPVVMIELSGGIW